jgi:type IV secretion system protein VirB10
MIFAGIGGERGLPSVGSTASMQSRISSLLAIGLMSVLGLGMLAWYYSHAIARHASAHPSVQSASKARAQDDVPLPPLGRVEVPQAPVAEAPRQLSGSTVAANLGPPSAVTLTPAASPYLPPAGSVPPKSAGQPALERQLSGPAFARQEGAMSVAAQPSSSATAVPLAEAATANAPTAATTAAATSEHSNSLPALLTPMATPAAQARVLPTQRLLLAKGAFIDCTLEAAIDTSLPGMTTCVTATDTFSVDGKVVLLERGTKLVGETQAEVQQGSSRVFVLWTEARTPTGVIVPLASPATDALGRSGLSGQVNRHFWDRFGAAILISVIDVALESSQHSNSGGTVIYGPTPALDIMTDVLKSTISIAPTIVKSQGDRIQVFVARDLDFRPVYELRAN